MSLEALYPMRIGVQPRSWEDITPQQPKARGSDVKDPGPRAGRIVRLMRDAENLRPRVEGLPRGSSWCDTESTLAHRIRQAEGWSAIVAEMDDAPNVSVERELSAKLTLQDGAASGWDVFPDGIGAASPGGIDDAMREIGQYIVDLGPPPPRPTPVPRGTNSGAPSYGSGDVEKLMHAYIAATITSTSSAEDIYATCASMFEAIPEIHSIMFSRTGPIRKPVAMYDWAGGGKFSHVANGTSVVPRRRAVFGVPAFINMAILPYANSVKDVILTLPWTRHESERTVAHDLKDAADRLSRPSFTSDDISGFDQSVTREHQLALARHVYARIWPEWVVSLWLAAQASPVLGGPLDATARAYLYRRPEGGMTTSGIITTSTDGTLINLARIITAMASIRGTPVRSAFRALRDGAWFAKIWGDDTVLVTSGSLDADKYIAANTRMGFTTALLPGATYLMKHYDISGGRVYPLATRAIQQTWWNEHSGRSKAIELLGLYARTTGLDANPIGHLVWPLLLDCEMIERFGITDRIKLGNILQDPGIREELDTSIKADPSLVRGWIARAERGHGEDAAMLAWVQRVMGGPDPARYEMNVTQELNTGRTTARARAIELAHYLSTPVDDRPTPPKWLKKGQ